MKINIFLILMMFFVCFGKNKDIYVLDSEKKPNKNDYAKESVDNEKKSTAEIDFNWTAIPNYFQPHSPIDLYEKCKKISLEYEKGEYETTNEYNKRIQLISNKKLINNLTIDSLFILRVNIDSWDIKYDADQEVLSYRMWSEEFGVKPPYEIREKLNLDYDSQLSCFELLSDEKIINYYKGSNAFGVEKSIVEKEINKYIFLLNNRVSTLFNYQFKINVTEAKLAKDNLSLLLFIKLKLPYVSSDIEYHRPTITEPKDIKTYLYYFLGDVEMFWIYNNSTGSIYQKINIR